MYYHGKKTFPGLPIEFYEVWQERLELTIFRDDRLKDAVAHVIRTCEYPMPTIAKFLSYDRKIKLHTYNEYCKLISDGDNGDNYKPIKFKDRPVLMWVHVNDIAQHNIKSEND